MGWPTDFQNAIPVLVWHVIRMTLESSERTAESIFPTSRTHFERFICESENGFMFLAASGQGRILALLQRLYRVYLYNCDVKTLRVEGF